MFAFPEEDQLGTGFVGDFSELIHQITLLNLGSTYRMSVLIVTGVMAWHLLVRQASKPV